MNKCPSCGVTLVVPDGHAPGCPYTGLDSETIASLKFKVGDYARSIESGWIGRIRRIYNEPYRVREGDPPIDELYAEMIGVDTLACTVSGCSWDEALSDNDIQHFALDDLRKAR